MTISLSPRLLRVAEFVLPNSRLCDVGSDHAYLPAYLAQKKQIEFAVAGEVVEGPYLSACHTVKEYGLSEVIDVRLANGLLGLEEKDAIDTITICGMGGELIASILEEGKAAGKLLGKERLILQPNMAEHFVRRWLNQNHYRIIAEDILEDNQRVYEIIVAVPYQKLMNYSEIEIEYGVFLSKEKPFLAIEKWKQIHQKYAYILKQLEESQIVHVEKQEQFHNKMKTIEELIADDCNG